MDSINILDLVRIQGHAVMITFFDFPIGDNDKQGKKLSHGEESYR